MNESSADGLAVGDKPIVGELERDCDGAFDSLIIVSLGRMAEGPEEGEDVGVKD
jgi:hypothetical protein